MTAVNQLGTDILSREEIRAQLDKFLAIYDERPLKEVTFPAEARRYRKGLD